MEAELRAATERRQTEAAKRDVAPTPRTKIWFFPMEAAGLATVAKKRKAASGSGSDEEPVEAPTPKKRTSGKGVAPTPDKTAGHVVVVRSRRTKKATLERDYPGCSIFDVTSKAALPWRRLSPFFPIGNVPVPTEPSTTSLSGLKVFKNEGCEPGKLKINTLSNLKRGKSASRGPLLGHATGFQPSATGTLLGYVEARKQIYVPAYLSVLRRLSQTELAELAAARERGPVVLLDYDTNGDVEDTAKPLSHASLRFREVYKDVFKRLIDLPHSALFHFIISALRSAPPHSNKIEFGVFSPQEVKKLSVVELHSKNLYDVHVPKRPPTQYGALDRRLNCVGHFGVVRLTLPVFHIGYFKLMMTVLQNICKRAFLRRLRNPNIDGLQRKDILKALNTACKKVSRCPHCEQPNGTVKKVGALKIIHEKFKKKKAPEEAVFKASFQTALSMDPTLKPHINKAQDDLSPLTVMKLLERLSDEDCEVLGMDPARGRPELFIWTALPVPPVCVRPSVGQEDSSNEDDLTVLVSDIIQINTEMKTIIETGLPVTKLMEHWDFLQLQCAITVISPDPNLRIDQVAVPERMAKILTYPERVTSNNIERLRQNVINGADKHPGASYVQTASGVKKFLRYGDRNKIAEDLRIGDVVDRHLHDGDIVLFNRQPSLHKLSIMSHFAKVRPWRTLRFNECVCTPYNADFDGDEMNLHLPQTEEARAEAQELMGIKNNLVTPRNGEPLIAATQDFITASYLQSNKDRFYDRAQFTHICSYMADAAMDIEIPPPTILKPMMLWTGKQTFNEKSLAVKGSRLHPEQLDRSMCRNDGYLVLYNSDIMSGVIDKSIIGAENKKSLFYTVLRDCGAVAAAECMNRVAKLSARWLANQGFSIGIDDVQPGDNLKSHKESMVEEAYRKCDDFIRMSLAGELPSQPGSTDEQTLESEISRVLSKVREDVGNTCMTELNKYNAPLIMALCGSKGSKINVSQMVACVGQQIISGNRIPNGFLDRSLPHFPKNSKLPAAKGFVRNSFYSGLAPPEFFFHAVSGREGLVDTAVKTAETGYMQRRLMKAHEDLTAHYDLSVRNSTGGVVQFTYGDDGLDPAKIEASVQPVDFARNLLHSMALSIPDDEPLFAFEVRKILVESREALLRTCSEEYVKNLCQFIENEVIKPDIIVRQKLGVNTGETEGFTGTAVGAVGAQSIGEPGTQMTLKTFHFAGVASMNVTLGVPRIKEIINASKKIATPIIHAELVRKTSQDERAARVVKGRIERTVLKDIAEYIEEVVAADDCYLRVKIDADCINKLQVSSLSYLENI
ncbi:hypothetical protein HK405_000629 [Cladochytrium tenue]|nr:hypothetical protein HK405_000629 [Cladochytrium tenue]